MLYEVITYEKFIMDADQASIIGVMLKGIDLSENGQALDALREVGPGAHFLGAAHTQANFERAFYRSIVARITSYNVCYTKLLRLALSAGSGIG